MNEDVFKIGKRMKKTKGFIYYEEIWKIVCMQIDRLSQYGQS